MDGPTTIPEQAHSGKRRRRKSSERLAAIRHIWHDWWVEIVVGLLATLAILLLVERMNIRQTLLAWLVTLVGGLQGLLSHLASAVIDKVRHTTLSDLVAYALLLIVLCLVVWRTRQRLTTMPRFTALRCPRCGSEMYRVHRHWHDRVLDLFVPVRRYRCKNQDCTWRGLRVKCSRHE
jgi:hypothetical protein